MATKTIYKLDNERISSDSIVHEEKAGEYKNLKAILNEMKNQNVLWHDVWYMNGSQTANLSQKISEQQHGIVLVWQAYDNGSAKPWHYNFCFVPKWQALTNPGCGVSMWLTNDVGSQVASKYVYLYDNKIVGHVNNSTGATNRGSGITVTNNHWVLTYVIGV